MPERNRQADIRRELLLAGPAAWFGMVTPTIVPNGRHAKRISTVAIKKGVGPGKGQQIVNRSEDMTRALRQCTAMNQMIFPSRNSCAEILETKPADRLFSPPFRPVRATATAAKHGEAEHEYSRAVKLFRGKSRVVTTAGWRLSRGPLSIPPDVCWVVRACELVGISELTWPCFASEESTNTGQGSWCRAPCRDANELNNHHGSTTLEAIASPAVLVHWPRERTCS